MMVCSACAGTRSLDEPAGGKPGSAVPCPWCGATGMMTFAQEVAYRTHLRSVPSGDPRVSELPFAGALIDSKKT